MPAFKHGKNTAFALGTVGTPATLVDLSPYLMQVQFPQPTEVAETSTFGTVAKTYVVGLKSSGISFSGRYDNTLDIQLSALLGSETAVTWCYAPTGSTTVPRYTGTGFITSYDIQGAIGDMVGFSVQIQVTGAVTRNTTVANAWPAVN